MPHPFQTPGYEDLELSTQIVIKSALSRGIKVEVLDRKANLLRLSKGNHVEYVQEATKTSRTSYISSLLINNKKASKLILKEKNIRVPEGKDYDDLLTASKDFDLFKGQKTVVKPKTTNFGIGVTVLDQNFTTKDFEKALTHAFSFDTSVLVEEFIPGVEYRFLVMAGKTVGVINRVPANVTGDGSHSIHELITAKSQEPNRGEWCRAPLEYLQMGKVEEEVLKEQNLNMDSIPKKGLQIFIRHNSNLSTGGDSIDFTDIIHPDYKKIAEAATAAVDVQICGVDMMIQNPNEAPNPNNHSIIEINDNPGITMHNFPYQGTNRNTGEYVLDILGF